MIYTKHMPKKLRQDTQAKPTQQKVFQILKAPTTTGKGGWDATSFANIF